MESSDPGHFFQTTHALSESARKAEKSKNKNGDPIQLPSKILAVAQDPLNEAVVYVAEAAGTVKKIDLETSVTTQTFTGPAAPLTSLAISPRTNTLYAGCWDRTIWSWSTSTRKPGLRFRGHADFVKSLLLVTVGGKELLVSGSADATLGVWDTQTGERLHTLKGHGRAILALALDPGAGDDADTVQAESDTVRIFSASSDRLIKTWHLTPTRASMHLGNILAHETSIDALHFDSNGDLWTASADKTAKCLSRSRNWQPDTSLEHPDFVRDVYVDEVGGFVVTACRDEEVRVWEAGSGKLVHVYEGHYEEVIGLCGRVVDGKRVVVSVGIDGGVRRWGVGQKEVAEAVKRREEEGKGVEKVEEKKESMLTEEEERELAELMGESDGE